MSEAGSESGFVQPELHTDRDSSKSRIRTSDQRGRFDNVVQIDAQDIWFRHYVDPSVGCAGGLQILSRRCLSWRKFLFTVFGGYFDNRGF